MQTPPRGGPGSPISSDSPSESSELGFQPRPDLWDCRALISSPPESGLQLGRTGDPGSRREASAAQTRGTRPWAGTRPGAQPGERGRDCDLGRSHRNATTGGFRSRASSHSACFISQPSSSPRAADDTRTLASAPTSPWASYAHWPHLLGLLPSTAQVTLPRLSALPDDDGVQTVMCGGASGFDLSQTLTTQEALPHRLAHTRAHAAVQAHTCPQPALGSLCVAPQPPHWETSRLQAGRWPTLQGLPRAPSQAGPPPEHFRPRTCRGGIPSRHCCSYLKPSLYP